MINNKITNNDLEQLHMAAQIYDKLKGKDYLIAYGTNSRKEIKFTEIRINPKNFWHLLGYHIKNNIDNDTRPILYNIILEKDTDNFELLKNSLECTHDKQIRNDKYNVFMKVFNFINKANVVDLANTQNTPDKYNFDFAIGNDFGIVGYRRDYDERTNPKNIPVSIQKKNIDKLNKPMNTMFAIFSKGLLTDMYDTLNYSVSKNPDFLDKIINDIPYKYKISLKLNGDKTSINNNSKNANKNIERGM